MRKLSALPAAVFLIIYCLHCFSGISLFSVHAQEVSDEMRGPAFVLIETGTGTVIEKNREHDRIPAGPFNKLMTLLIVMEKMSEGCLSPDTELTVSEQACRSSGAVVWLEKGEKIKVSELLRAVAEGNACDAAAVLAEAVTGDPETFTAVMNARAKLLGMEDTHFTSPSENDDEHQYSSASDMALLARELSAYPQLSELMTSWHDYIRGGKTELVNENRLVRTYNGITGMKAGHSPVSGYSAVVSAERGEKKYIAAVFGCEDEDSRFSKAKELLDRGFSGYVSVVPGFSPDNMKPLGVRHGTERAVMITARSSAKLVIPKESSEDLRTVVFLPEYIEAPVRKGQEIGILAYYNGRTLLYETPLVTEKSVEKITFLSSFKKILRKMFK